MSELSNLLKTIEGGLDKEAVQRITPMLEQARAAIALVARLRAPNGCPWDKEQDHLSLRQYLIEEAYEVLDVIDQGANPKALKEELGDLLLQVLLHSQLAQERGEFSFGDVAQGMAAKLVSRHPHVFGEATAKNSEEVLQNWEQLKKKEGRKSVVDGLPKSLPSLQRASRLGEKVARLGFDWPNIGPVWEKIDEELAELKDAEKSGDKAHLEHELGDVLFSVCNLARHLKIEPEGAHRKAIERFEMRFRRVEELCGEKNIDMAKAGIEKLDEIWAQVKLERSGQ